MLDKLVAVVKVKHKPIGLYSHTDISTGVATFKSKALVVKGSHNSAKVRTYGSYGCEFDQVEGEYVLVEGNPPSWSQGHNVFGSRDMKMIGPAFIKSVLRLAGIDLSDNESKEIDLGEFDLYGVDVNLPFTLPSQKDAREYLSNSFNVISSKTRSKPWNYENSIYIGAQHKNDYKLIRIYNKYQELDDKCGTKLDKLSKALNDEQKALLKKHAEGMIRFEVSYRRKWLKKNGLDRGKDWFDQARTRQLLEKELKMVNLPMNVELTEKEAIALPPHHGRVYDSWLAGGWERIQQRYSPRACERHRSDFLKEYKIDLKSPPKNIQESNIVPLWRYIEPTIEPEIPAWAKGTPLYFDPRRNAARAAN